jgi:predicted  nucleic acid-binding Zn-ribbon protein
MDPARPLLELQALDSAIDRLSARGRSLEAGETLDTVRANADAAERTLGDLRLRLDTFDRDSATLEHEVDTISQKVAAEERRMYDGSVANAKELDAIRHEVDNLKNRRTAREDELLALMEQREDVERAAKEAQRAYDDLRAAVEEVGAEATADLASTRSELEGKTAEREAAARHIAPELLELYEDLRPQKKGVAAVALVDGVCQGCHEQLSAVELGHLKKAEGVKRCEHCRRILVT